MEKENSKKTKKTVETKTKANTKARLSEEKAEKKSETVKTNAKTAENKSAAAKKSSAAKEKTAKAKTKTTVKKAVKPMKVPALKDIIQGAEPVIPEPAKAKRKKYKSGLPKASDMMKKAKPFKTDPQKAEASKSKAAVSAQNVAAGRNAKAFSSETCGTGFNCAEDSAADVPGQTVKPGKIKVLFASFESMPFTVTGGLGEVAGSLPGAINGSEFEVRVILPKLKQISDEYVEDMKYICNFSVSLGWRSEYCGLFRLKLNGVTYYFLDNEKYFYRNNIYGEFDDGERMAFYAKAVLESLMYLPGFFPDILHANDWHASLIPVFLREHYRYGMEEYRNLKTILTIHNLKFQGKYSSKVIGDVCGLEGTPADRQMICGKDTANYLQAGAIYADWVTTVSPNYAEEICMPYYGEGLDWLFRKRRGNSLSGILNGIDTVAYDPKNDKYIAENYSEKDLSGKAACKRALQEELGFEQNPDIPLFVLVSRLTEQKGLDLLTYNLQKITECDMQLAVLGVGDYNYEEAFGWYSHNYPNKIAFRREFNNALSHRMYAGADAALIPSRFEPCGLTQMIAMRYGALPIIRETGGLKDSVVAYYVFGTEQDENGNIKYIDNVDIAQGYSFENFDAGSFITAVYNALSMWYNRRDLWTKMQQNAMKADFSWKQSAKEYRELYKLLMGR